MGLSGNQIKEELLVNHDAAKTWLKLGKRSIARDHLRENRNEELRLRRIAGQLANITAMIGCLEAARTLQPAPEVPAGQRSKALRQAVSRVSRPGFLVVVCLVGCLLGFTILCHGM
jgi:hypothetical protein